MNSAEAPPTATQMRRLALVRRLYELGLEQSRSAGPAAGLALLSFHDAVEMLLQLLSEHLDVRSKTKEFLDYWPTLETLGLRLGGRANMARMNTARVNLKHRGLLPASFELEGFRAATTNVLNEGCLAGFGQDLESVSLTAMVADEATRSLLERAEAALIAGNHEQALSEAAVAFVLLLRNYHSKAFDARGMPRQYSLAEAATGALSHFDANDLVSHFDGHAQFKARRAFEAITRSTEVFSEALTVMGYGLDFRSYMRFKSHMPVVHVMIAGNTSVQWMKDPTDDPAVVQDSINFVVDTALRLAE